MTMTTYNNFPTDDMYSDSIGAPSNWKTSANIIKVIGVGGGGCNAVEYMYSHEDIKGADFIVCNTDKQALDKCSVPCKIAIGGELTRGLGAGCDPLKGKKAAIESQDDIKALFEGTTEMVFVTCGMGGGTGTGAAPVIADIVHKMGLLTVGVVTVPSEDEGYETMARAIEGIHEMEKCVDSLLVINNQKLYEVYGELPLHEIFPKSDEVLATAVRGITEIITDTGYINVDFADVKNVMRSSGMALMGSGSASGEDRVQEAVRAALSSPLLNDFDLTTARNVLINVRTSRDANGLYGREFAEIAKCIQGYTGNAQNFKKGVVYDDSGSLNGGIHVTIIATGFNMSSLPRITKIDRGNLITIDENYVSDSLIDKDEDSEAISLPPVSDEEVSTQIIGKTTSTEIRSFHYETRPALAVEPGEDISVFANTPSIRRSNDIRPITISRS